HHQRQVERVTRQRQDDDDRRDPGRPRQRMYGARLGKPSFFERLGFCARDNRFRLLLGQPGIHSPSASAAGAYEKAKRDWKRRSTRNTAVPVTATSTKLPAMRATSHHSDVTA